MALYGHGIGMTVWMAVFWVLVVGMAVWLLGTVFPRTASSQAERSDPAGPRHNPALQVVRQRYAAGEITRAEFEELRATLADRR